MKTFTVVITDIRDTIIALAIIYIIGVAVSWEFNPMNWIAFGKALTGLAVLFILSLWFSVVRNRVIKR